MNVLMLILSIATNHNNGLFPRYVQKCASRLTILFSLGNQIEIETGSGSKKMEEIKPSKRQWIFSMVLLWPYPLQANHQTSEIFIVRMCKKNQITKLKEEILLMAEDNINKSFDIEYSNKNEPLNQL